MPFDAALSSLRVIDRLEVGPVELSPERLVAPYTVTCGRQTDRIDLVYKYEEPVFSDEELAGGSNLASVIAAQVALNYGLFCKEIVYYGPYSKRDRRFLTEMARHTAREIYVNKLLKPNPFLLETVGDLPAGRREDFLGSRLRFEAGSTTVETSGWETDRGRHAILSSGGKDSLLTFGLLDEIGVEVHPLFVNESGRHWYTAINAYRHFKDQVPNTSRIWTSADRVFSWMLRHLPFVRQDFAKVRSDEYPIRLWTVAVFLFGALPLLRKRGIGRLLIGDEFDTTVRLSYRGITHYGGLYDQSRYFDNMLTRYFSRKRWKVSQFSVVRPLSELLIEKVLVERYPHLQRHQMSCHATHLEEERAHPCGRCEKCRRIVAMLRALGADPRHCGYTEEQIADGLRAFAEHGIHQEASGAQHAALLLLEKGLIPPGPADGVSARPHPEVLKLRFDPERSPFDTIPTDLRAPLYRILLEHAAGAVRRSGRLWIEVNPLAEQVLAVPYRFEPLPGRLEPDKERSILFGQLTWPDVEATLAEVDIALLPVGAVEQHGPHLPLDTDAYDAERLCRDVAGACTRPRPLVLPLISYGVSYHHEDFKGTISVNPETLAQLVYDIGISISRQGVTKLVIINGHSGNDPALNFAAQKINRDAHIFTCVDSGESSDAEIDSLAQTRNDVHAGEIETSTSLATRPHLVKLDLARASVPRFSSEYLEFSSKKGVKWYVRTARISQSGVLGDPTRATREKGERFWSIMVRNLVELVEYLKGMTLDEIYQRRY